jgi:uncharacterized membrane protein
MKHIRAKFLILIIIIVSATYLFFNTNDTNLNLPINTQNNMETKVYEVRSGEIKFESKQVLYTYVDGTGETTFIIPIDSKDSNTYAIVPFRWPVRPDARFEQGESWIYQNGIISPLNEKFSYKYPELKGMIQDNGVRYQIDVKTEDMVVIESQNFSDLQKLPGFEDFSFTESE